MVLYQMLKSTTPYCETHLCSAITKRNLIMKVPHCEYNEYDAIYSPKERKEQQEAFELSERDRMYEEYRHPDSVEARNIKKHSEIRNDYNANNHRANAIAEAEDKMKAAARASNELFNRYDNVPAFEREVERLVSNERKRVEKLYPKREDKYKYVYLSSGAMRLLMEAVLNGKTTRDAYEQLQQDEVLTHAMNCIIKRYGYDLDIPEFIEKAKRRGSYHVKGVYDGLVEQYASQHIDEKFRAKKFKQASSDNSRAKWQPEEVGTLYDNIRLIDAAGMWGKDYKKLYTTSERGIEGCLAKLARALKLARLSVNLTNSKKEIGELTTELHAVKAKLETVQNADNLKKPNHIPIIHQLWKEQGISAAKMLPILIAAGCYSDIDIENKDIRRRLLNNITQEIGRIKNKPKKKT